MVCKTCQNQDHDCPRCCVPGRDDLIARYPDYFPAGSIRCGDGWIPLLDGFCRAIRDSSMTGFAFVSVVSRWGRMEVTATWDPMGDDGWLFDLLDDMEGRSQGVPEAPLNGMWE